MADVFISYSRKDKEFVQRLDDALRKRQREAWVDWEGIRPTEEFMQAIYGAIEGADTFIFVLSPDSVAAAVCGKEIAHAVAQNKRMVPIVAREVNAAEVPEALAKLNWIFCRESDAFDTATDTLISALDTDLDWVRAHTRLLTRAVEWEAKDGNNSFVLRGVDLRAAEQWLTEAGADKERQPTPLQTAYIIASRKAAARRLRITLGAVAVGALIAIGFAILASFQRNRAVAQEKIAIENANEARRTSAQADFNLAMFHRPANGAVDPRTLMHLARAFRTKPDAALPRQYLISILRDRSWCLVGADPLRHRGEVLCALFSPDGKRIATASEDQSACIWDTESGALNAGPLRHGGEVASIAFSPDGRAVVTTSLDKTARIWNAENGQRIGKTLGHLGSIGSAAFNSDGSLIVTASSDRFLERRAPVERGRW